MKHFYKNGSFYLNQSESNDRTELTEEYFNELFAKQAEGQEIYDDNGFPRVRKRTADPKEVAHEEINSLKAKLAQTDYQAIKYAEGLIPEAEYAPIKAQRQAWRARINELETLGG